MSSRVLVLGVGAFAHAVQSILEEDGAETACYLTRPYSHYGPKIVGKTWKSEEYPSPLPIIKDFKPDLIIPQSVAWAEQTWSKEIVEKRLPIFSPITGGVRSSNRARASSPRIDSGSCPIQSLVGSLEIVSTNLKLAGKLKI